MQELLLRDLHYKYQEVYEGGYNNLEAPRFCNWF